METSEIYAFGQRWGPENDKRDQYSGFRPGNGIHDIHMNQGNRDQWVKDDGTWQDGGIIFHYPDENRLVAVFLAFQSQCFHTDDICEVPTVAATVTIDKRVIIIAALVNPAGSEERNVTILNASPESVTLNEWKLADRNKMKMNLAGTLNAEEIMKITITSGTSGDFTLSKEGGIITLMDNKGLEVDGVSYTEEDTSKEGWTTIF